MKRVMLLIFMCIICSSLISSAPSVILGGDSGTDSNSVKLEKTAPTTNYSLVNTNHSNSSDYANFWDDLDTPADILHSDLNNLDWSVAGHNIDTDIDMNGNTFTDLENIIINAGSYLGSWGTILRIANSLIPIGLLDLGNSTNPWRSLYINGTNSNITLNDSAISDWTDIGDYLVTIYYNASQPLIKQGSVDGGAIADTQHKDGLYDGTTFNFSEQAGSPALDLRMNFTDIDSFNQGIMRYKTSSLAGDYPIIQMWDYADSEWEDYPPVAESENFKVIVQPVFDGVNHVSGGVAQMRIYKAGNGNTNNHYYIDWVAVSQGYGTPSGEETDPYSWHRGTIDSGNFNTTGNLSLPYLCDLFGNCINVSTFISEADAVFIDSNVYWAERGTITAGLPWGWGNGRSPRGSAVGYNSTIVKVAVECVTAGTSLVVGVRKNGLVTNCNVTATASNRAFTNDCNLTFNETDILGIYAEKEVNSWTDCVGTAWVERNRTISISGLKGDKGDAGDVGLPYGNMTPRLWISECSKDADSMVWDVRIQNYSNENLSKYGVAKCWASDEGQYAYATDNMVCSSGGVGYFLSNDIQGSKYYSDFITNSAGAFDIDCLGSSGGGSDCWLMCELDGIVYSSPTCSSCPSGVPP